ncbi:MAG: Ppx/GppA family phosphatase [Alphaproteobacteria bacterium]|nr:Ppx/GppA family phosphatase [Alphaproteobacteria bacterium]
MPGVLRSRKNGKSKRRGPVAVIDIGSNSVRLVVYEGKRRAPLPVFNEKVLCGLARGLDSTGKLSAEGVEMALGSLHRFAALTEAMGVARIDTVATAAVREASDGPDFAAAVKRQCGLDVKVLSGAEEARRSALGVISAFPGADGLMADLGGGSVEVVRLEDGQPGQRATMPLGSLRMADDFGGSMRKAQPVVDTHIEELDWLGQAEGTTFYAVGGAWRALARAHMYHTDYPLHVIHSYRIAAKEAINFSRFVAELSHSTLERTPGVSRQRIVVMPHAALVLRRLLEDSGVDEVVLCAYGLREGCLYDRLSAKRRLRDPLIEASRDVSRRTGRATADGETLFDWIGPVFDDETAAQRRLRLATCELADIGWSEHPDYRSEQAFVRILRMPLVGVDHSERAFIALSVAARHSVVKEDLRERYAGGLLGEAEIERARATALALRLAYTVSGGVISLLEQTAIRRKDGRLTLILPEHADILVGDVVERRFRSLARAVECEAKIAYEPDVEKAIA